ncbi:MAG: CPBP family intramembrane metalloprotease [Lachnospiraceae bacterium]|nr:CPBP family intramembrane metalloprotease [Lachnospiraceae bacterium]
MTIPFAVCLFPPITLLNAISMLFVDNVALEDTKDILSMSPMLAFFLLAVVPAFFEEFAFRGLIYGGYRRHCRPLGAIVITGLLFGLMHGNLNQFCYTFVFGMILAMLVEASGSIWPAILTHMIINSKLVITLFIEKYLNPDAIDELLSSQDTATAGDLYMCILVYALLSIITLMMAGAMLSWIAQNEGMVNPIKVLRNNKKFCACRTSVWSLSLVVGVALSATLLAATELLTYLTGY